MPYFMWRGVDIKGRMHRGKIFARSEQELDTLLFKREIALLKHTIAKTWSLSSTISQETKIHFFRQLASLIRSGLLLHDALIVLNPQIGNIRFQQIIATITDNVNHGKQLSDALHEYPQVFDTMTIYMMRVGQESGSLALCAEMVADHLQSKHQLNKQLRSAATMPLITLLFFMAVLLIIFIAVIPIFAEIFASTNKPLPMMTHIMLSISTFLRSYYVLFVVGILGLIVYGGKKYIAYKKPVFDSVVVQLPIIGSLVRRKFLVYFTQSLSLLLKAGIQLVPALPIAQKTVTNTVFREVLVEVEQEVTAGTNLNQACARHQEWFEPETIAMLLVGQESGQLGEMLHKVAVLQEDKIKETLSFIVKVIQPLLMVSLGLLVTALLFSVYMPILSLPQVITT